MIQAHLKAYEEYEVLAVRGAYLPKTAASFSKLADHYCLSDMPFPTYANLEGNISYQSRAFYQVGGWDAEMSFDHGGIDLSIRLLKYDHDARKQIYSPAPVVYKDFVRDEEHPMLNDTQNGRSDQKLRAKYPDYDGVLEKWKPFEQRSDTLLRKVSAAEDHTRRDSNIASGRRPRIHDSLIPKHPETIYDNANRQRLLEDSEEAIQTGNLQRAEQILHVMLIHNSQDVEALNDLAVVDVLRRSWDDAKNTISRILEIDPNNTVARQNLAVIRSFENTEVNS